jgi:hypothetical protein
MNISATTLSSITQATATQATAQVAPAQSAPVADATGAFGADRTHLSKMGELMSKLQDLESSDPNKAKQVLSNIASALADKASADGNADPQLQALSDKFAQAAQTGDLSGLKPQGGHHHHHHAPESAQAPSGGASPADAQNAAAALSPRTASYQHAGADRMAEIESVISNALGSIG